jgi:hypothetical protein
LVRTHRLFIIARHESHCLIEFQDRGKEMKIITLSMPPHSYHLLQPLEVACFSPLKRAYGDAVSALARGRIHHIDNETFLPACKSAFEKTFTADNICAGFQGARSAPSNPDAGY